MRKLLAVCIALVICAGCASSSAAPGAVNGIEKPTPTPVPLDSVEGIPPIDKTWISPGKVQVGYYYPGAQAEWDITVHNGGSGDDRVVYMVTTDAGEDRAPILLPLGLIGLEYLAMSSSNPADKLSAVSYDDKRNAVMVAGLAENASRTITIDYKYPSPAAEFLVYYKEPNSVDQGFSMPPAEAKDWIIISDPTPVLQPFETRDITITLAMPEKATAPANWEYWICVLDNTQKGMVKTELCSRWMISMRE